MLIQAKTRFFRGFSCGFLVVMSLIGLSRGQAADLQSAAVPIGNSIETLRFKDIRFLERELSEFGKQKAYVIICINRTCPLVQRYLPKLNRMSKKFSGAGVQFIGLNVSEDSISEIANHAIATNCDFPFVKDIDHNCVRALGVKRTPEAVVLDANFRLLYRGRIDNQYRIGGALPQPSSNDLELAISAVVAGNPVAVSETPVDGCLITVSPVAESNAQLTFTDDVATLMHQHCVECHRTGSEAPFALTNYEDVAAHGEMIAEVVRDRRMPPWYASSEDKHFINHRGLSGDERETILQWVKEGMPRGEAKEFDEPAPIQTWSLGKPDKIIRAAESHNIPTDGYVPYKYSLLPYVFLHDTWLDAIQIVSDNPRVLHHCNLLAIPLGKKLSDAYFITGKVPGSQPLTVDSEVGILIPRGTALALQIHYTTTGQPEKCRISLGLNYAGGLINKQFRHLLVKNTTFSIPPGDGNHRVSKSETLDTHTTGLGLFTHMHLRGKDMIFLAHYPDGSSERLLTIPNYNFDWQMGYRWAPNSRQFPANTRFECIAHFDNSEFNPFNPDAEATVIEGQQTYHEMMYGFYFYTRDNEQLNLQINPKNGRVIR